MADNQNTGTTGNTGLLRNILSKLPYQSVDFNKVLDDINPKYDIFNDTGVKRSEALAKQSIFFSNDYNNEAAGKIQSDSMYNAMVYANIEENKSGRLRDYRVMAAFSEVAEALDEICDECINKDDKGNVVNIKFRDLCDLPDDDKEKIQEEFNKYIEFFELDKKGFEYFRQLLIEGELYFEHIIHKQYKKEGILGAVQLPPDLIDPIYDNIQNMLIKGYVLRKPVFDKNKPDKVERYDLIPMDENQITYISSGIWNQDKTFRLPFIENARRAYRQLSLIEDSIVIYRLVRAPEKLVFNVDVGNMAPPKAEAYLRRLMQEYWSKKTFDVNQAGPVQKFNPQSMLDSFWFAKRQGSEGTSVTSLPGGAQLGELSDLEYFINKLYKSLKVPLNRLNQESQFADGNEILREELKFARFIIRLQKQFAEGIKNGFFTHLKLKGYTEKFDFKPEYFDAIFNVPTNFYELRESQKLELKANNFNMLSQNESVSPTYAQKKYLGWSDIDVKANREFMRKDAEFRWELAQIEAGGPKWREADMGGAGEEDMGGDMMTGGEGGIPEFGGGEVDVGDGAGMEVPEEPSMEPPPQEPPA